MVIRLLCASECWDLGLLLARLREYCHASLGFACTQAPTSILVCVFQQLGGPAAQHDLELGSNPDLTPGRGPRGSGGGAGSRRPSFSDSSHRSLARDPDELDRRRSFRVAHWTAESAKTKRHICRPGRSGAETSSSKSLSSRSRRQAAATTTSSMCSGISAPRIGAVTSS